MGSKSKSDLEKLKIAEQLRPLIETKCRAIEGEAKTYSSFTLDRRPDGNLSGLLEKAAELRGAQDRVSSLRLDIISLQRTAKDKIKKYKALLKDVAAQAILQVDKATTGRRVSKARKDVMVRDRIAEFNKLVVELENIYDRTNQTVEIVKEVDANLRDSSFQLSNQINVIDKMVRIGEIRPEKGAYRPPVGGLNGKVKI